MLTLDQATDAVETARLIIQRLDGHRPTEAELRAVLADALDLAFYVTGEPKHLTNAAAVIRARALAGR